MNQNYDLQAVIDMGFKWDLDLVEAHLFTAPPAEIGGDGYDAAHTRLSQVGVPLQTQEIPGRSIVGDDYRGLSVAFLMIDPDINYEVVLAWNKGNGDPYLLGFFDEANGGAPIRNTRRGSLILRPTDAGDPPSYGTWLVAPAQP